MGRQELTQVLCPECGTSGESDPEASRLQCAQCGSGFFLRRCSACARVSYVDGLQGIHVPWPCTWCGRFNRGFSQNRDPAAATAAELAAEVARYGPPRAPAGPEAGDQALTRSPIPWTASQRFPSASPPRPGRRRMRLIGLPIVVAVGCAAAAALLLPAGDPGASVMAAAGGHSTRDVHLSAGRAGSIDFRGVPGQLTIVGTGSGQVTLTGQLDADGGAPAVETRLDRKADVLLVSVQCPPATQCTQSLRLAVPGDTAATVRQPGGRVVVTGLAGPLRITATHADISATGLRSAELTAALTSGHLSATFAAPPRQVSVTLASAQATLRLPARVAYRVTQEVTSGYVKVAVPQAGSAARTVTARLNSGELELLPS